MHTQTTAPAGVVLKPVRLNFAGVCIYCGGRDCVAARCIAAHEASQWEVCRNCNGAGFQFGSEDDPCFCCFGLVEVALPFPFNLAAFDAATVSPALADSVEKPHEVGGSGVVTGARLVCYGSDADNLVYVWEKR
ncbi:hypothetical protein Cs7R123_75880 [Catellatospora sp. TT07R-123]|uniref:hypothetical protein n=1 Tax=Catellatospora sp. TT07R-123 TaxID=2733863 RepID=UPI001B027F6A|nr:hypothetical protein [Catellatospora sp. TT07R-123]GHJ50246.1 hypothetical protein Cs7R123_75880 [Catellatospora sp. TT07R-123]